MIHLYIYLGIGVNPWFVVRGRGSIKGNTGDPGGSDVRLLQLIALFYFIQGTVVSST